MFAYPAIWSFYGKARFGWDAWMIGVSLAIFGISMALVQALAVGPAIRRWGEQRTARYGMLVDTVSFAAFGVVKNGTAALALTPVSAMGGVGGPALQGIMSNATPDNQQGELQGVLGSIAAVATGMSPLLMTGTFWLFTRPGSGVFMPGAPFLLSAGLMLICIAILVMCPAPKAVTPT
jgi:DHA1 family tetracycline resistance protein-like MFS transporter